MHSETMIENPYWEIFEKLGDDYMADNSPQWAYFKNRQLGAYATLLGPQIYASAQRQKLVLRFAWSVPSPKTLDFIMANLGEPRSIIEIGAGSGYWAWMLSQHGVDVRAFDAAVWPTRYHNIILGGPEVTKCYKDRTLMLCWPPYREPMGAQALLNYKGSKVIYIGEGARGCTGDDDFHDLLERDWELKAHRWNEGFCGIKDQIFIYDRK